MTASTLRFDAPARRWLERLPLGNGTLGAMIDGGVPTLRIGLNDETAWSGSPASESRAGLVSPVDAAAALADARRALARGDSPAAEAALRVTQVPYSQAYLPLGELEIALGGALDGALGGALDGVPDAATGGEYRRSLDLDAAQHSIRSGALRCEAFVSAPDGVLVVRVDGAPVDGVEITTPHHVVEREADAVTTTLLLRLPSDVAPTHEPDAAPAEWSMQTGAALEGAVVVGVAPDGEGTLVVVATATTFSDVGEPPRGAGDAGTDPGTGARDAAAHAHARVAEALGRGWDGLHAAHLDDVRPRMGRVRLALGEEPRDESGRPLATDARMARAAAHPDGPLAADPGLAELLFDYGRYLLLSSARPGGLPPTLQGIWNDQMQPPWSSNYTLNINMQMNAWAAHPTALDECVEPLHRFFGALARAGTPTAQRLYGTRGWVAHHNSDAWALTAPVGGGHGDARWTAWPMAGPWLAMALGDAIAFGAIDGDRLRASWEPLRGVAEFLLDWVRRDPGTGRFVTSPASSPENAYRGAHGVAALDETTTMDLALAQAALRTVVEAAGRLGIDDEIVRAARELAAALPDGPAIGADGTVVEWARERTADDPHHRHLSHLVGLYPGTQPWTADAREAAARTLARRGDDSSGWSLVWKGLLWARLGDADRVSALLRLLFRDAESMSGPWAGGLYPNMFAAHPPFQIDANLGFPALIAETLVQSHAETSRGDGDAGQSCQNIELLPALPSELHTGEVHGLIARPGVIVDIEWEHGKLVGARLRLRETMAATAVAVHLRRQSVRLQLTPGATVTLTLDDFAIADPAVSEEHNA